MDSETESSKFSNTKHNLIKNENFKYRILKVFIILIISYILFSIAINIILINFSIKSQNKFLKLNFDLNKTISSLKEFMKVKHLQTEEFNEIINEEYQQKQKYFCKNINEYYNHEFEKKIKFAKVRFNNITFIMSVYKKYDIISNEISKHKAWDKDGAYNLINGLNFYSKKKNLNNKDIYIIDIGGNIGWYTFLLGKFGYNIITFEPSRLNFYILKKNYCSNKEVNVTLINKGLFTENKICHIYSPKNNIGNGLVSCTEKSNVKFINNGEINLTKLSNYISFFKNKNLAMIKIDIEGSEGKAFESGIELINFMNKINLIFERYQILI